MTVGDIHSNDRGSGARYNSGKPDLSLIPLRILVNSLSIHYDSWTPEQFAAYRCLTYLADWQERRSRANLMHAWDALGPEAVAECARVFAYGALKYAAWNWSKGMAWSIPLACAARHILWGILAGEHDDPESGLPHRGHVACNLAMLMTYERTYREGDDRAPEGWLSNSA